MFTGMYRPLLSYVLLSALLWYGGVRTAVAAGEAEIPALSLVAARQEWGAVQVDKSVSGKELSIAGQKYAKGLGTHATSMILLPVPELKSGEGVTGLSGACGIDDGANGKGSVEFRVMSGTEVLWSSGVMKSGDAAKKFTVELAESNLRTVYLMADRVENNSYDHADWVDLKWTTATINAKKNLIKIDAAKFGMTPGVKKDQGPALRKALSALRKRGSAKVLNIPKGVYHFYEEGALKMCFNVSNHDQPLIHPVCVPLNDLKNVRIEGNGSLFVFHGKVMPMLLMDSENVSVCNLSIDYARPWCTEARVLSLDDKTIEVSIDRKQYPCKLDNGHLKFVGEGWQEGISCAMAFEKGTGHIIYNTADLSWGGRADYLGGDRYKLHWGLKHKGVKPGDTLVLRNYLRPLPGCVVYRSNGTKMKNVAIHHSFGMAFLAQRSKDFYMNGGGVFIREGTNRVHTSGADATHFSNVSGKVVVENARFEGMMDDAINVHSTCLAVEKLIDERTILCRYKHRQAVGFEVFLPGEQVRFINGPVLEPGQLGTVAAVKKLSDTELQITLKDPLPAEVKAGDAIENADYYPSVVFRNNVVTNNRARGTLFTTPKSVLVEGNVFDNSSGSALLLAGDAQGWYESGACYDVVIRKNKFRNNLTSRYQFTNAIISIYPEVRQLANQKAFYHRNVVIEDNDFDTFDVPLLFAISTDNLKFINNRITYNNDYKGWGQPPFEFKKCGNVLIKGNKITPAREWTIKDCKLHLTPPEHVKVER